MIVFVGAGGKTSAVNRLARELVSAGEKVIITTSTKIFPPQALAYRLLLLEEEGLNNSGTVFPAEAKILVLGKKINEEQKIVGLDRKEIKVIRERLPDTVILVEGDGAKGKPFKAPRDHEPVIPLEATLVVPVIGVDVLGRPLDGRYFHAGEQIGMLTGLRMGDDFRAKDAARVLLHEEGYRKGIPPAARWIPLINKVDTPLRREKALELAEILIDSGVEKVLLGALGSANSQVELVGRK